ncbi:MAG: HAMP domain-containing histidine kinase [Desulfobacterales bacterium]|nr:HAMP domain-containing histidine kinase [Desulfobacterales bacterium]MBF0395818.1 HAMP domain-containing histidine kinase [Desulfobacterales bacterium]
MDNNLSENSKKPTLANALISQAELDIEKYSVFSKALTERPSLSIRTKIILTFSLFFALCAIITLWSIVALSEIEDKINFLETADNYLSEIHQARRFEKNYLLYRTNVNDALEHLSNAEKILSEKGKTIEKILGEKHFKTVVLQVKDYDNVLNKLSKTRDAAIISNIEPTLRENGSKMVSFAEDFVKKERDSIARMLSLSRKVPFFFLGVLMALMIFVAILLTRQLIVTLNRFVEYANRIGEGDFSPITPVRKFKDEFTQLAKAFNSMTRELDNRHKILVESHKLRAIGTLVAGIAHELNNPLNNTMLTASMLKEDFSILSEEEKLSMIDDIISETERSRGIVRNLLDFARESEANLNSLQVQEIIDDSIKLVSNQIKLAKIRLETDYAKDLPHIHGDEQMLKQVFVNLILNAIDALPQKGSIFISVQKNKEEEGYITVEVKDNGPGIPEHILPQIFDPFFTTKTKGKGTGLGLSVCRGIVRKLGGYIRVKSSVGSGTVFTVLLPTTNIPSEISSGKKEH